MAWLHNLAGKAEDFLNKIDQNAATVLNDNSQRSSKDEEMIINVEEDKYVEAQPVTDNIPAAVPTSPTDDLPLVAQSNQNFVVDEVVKSSCPGSKSISSNNSFVLSEDVQNYNDIINKLELEVRDLSKQLLNLQHSCAELRNDNANLQSQVETANSLVATAQTAMEQYKARAQRILQEKEELIVLKYEKQPLESSDHLIINYNEELKKEIEFQQKQNGELTEKIKSLNQDVAYLQQQLVLTQNSAQKSAQILQESLDTEKKIRLIAEEECRVKNQELQLRSQQLTQQYHLLQLNSAEIEKLHQALKDKTTNSNVGNDFELRIKSLTDTLMTKQNALETVTTERNALRLQVEKLETEFQNNLAQLERAQVRVINVNDTDDVKSQVPQFMRVSPFDAGVTKRVKHAYSTLDAISVRTGVFLRRYPVARVFVFCYMVLLHIWALILLFVYAPSNR